MAKRNPTTAPFLDYEEVTLDAIVGKTIQGIARTTVEGESGKEPCVMLFFSDGTKHGFVLPADNWDEEEWRG